MSSPALPAVKSKAQGKAQGTGQKIWGGWGHDPRRIRRQGGQGTNGGCTLGKGVAQSVQIIHSTYLPC